MAVCKIKYGSQLLSSTFEPEVSITYDDRVIGTLIDGEQKRLKCNGKIMSTDVVIGSKKLKCADKLMGGDVTVTFGDPVVGVNYLHFTAEESSTITLTASNTSASGLPTVYYSFDRTNWTLCTYTQSISVAQSSTIWFKGDNSTFSVGPTIFAYFQMTGKLAAAGNVMTLMDSTGELMTVPDNAFRSLFTSCSALTQAPMLPATTIGASAYYGMFRNCTSLVYAPLLPATTVNTTWCYSNMFDGCSSLKYVKILYTGNFSDTYFNQWLSYVGSGGDFYYNGTDTTRSTSAIPSSWTVHTF